SNLAITVIDNEHYGETGMQPTHTRAGVDLAGIARTCGFRQTATVRQMRELDAAVAMLHTADGPVLVVIKVSSARDPLVLPSWDGALLKSRFRQALLGGEAAGKAKSERKGRARPRRRRSGLTKRRRAHPILTSARSLRRSNARHSGLSVARSTSRFKNLLRAGCKRWSGVIQFFRHGETSCAEA